MIKRVLRALLCALLLAMLLTQTAAPAFAKVGKIYVVAVQGLRQRSSPKGGDLGNVLRSLKKGTKVVHLSSKGNWWRVRTAKGNVGYVFSKYLIASGASTGTGIKAGKTYKVTASALVVRRGPGTSYKRLGSLRRGQRVAVLAVNGAWARISRNGKVGYVAKRYLG
ncbi:MAG: SH3 domain-containing protein [Christensenellales bacterium]|jgi:uncharacterized protein YgiM (DUF1202 family)